MANRHSLQGRVEVYKSRYRRIMQDVIASLENELEHLNDDNFEPSAAIASAAFRLIEESNRLKSLLEVDPEVADKE